MTAWIAAVLNSIWQAFAIAASVWFVLKIARRVNAATRHIMWWIVLAVVILLPAASILVERKQASRNPVATSAIEMTTPHASVGPSASGPRPPLPARRPAPVELRAEVWLIVVPLIWLAALLLQFTRIIWSYLHVRKLKFRSPSAPPDLQRCFDRWILSTGVHRGARLLVSTEIASPMAVGFLHPAVILPECLPARLTADEMDQVLLHELAHLARLDHWTNLFARVTGAFLALHPVAVWILRRIERERELACDDWVVSQTGQPRPYAESLARLFELCWKQRRILLASGMAGRPSQLGGRIEALLRSRREGSPKASAIPVAISIVALMICGLLAAAAPRWIAIARSPRPAPPISSRRFPLTRAQFVAAAAPQKPVAQKAPAPQGGFLAALVEAGYSDLSVDEIIELKNAGISPEFLRAMSQSGWGKLPPRDLIALRSHGVSADYAADILEAGLTDLSIARVIELRNQGVRPDFVQTIHALGFGPFDSRQIIDLHNHGIRSDFLRALKDAGYRAVDHRSIIEAASAGLRENDLREARQFGSTLNLRQIIKLKQAGVLR